MQEDEYLDIVNENDVVIGKDLRSNIYAKNLSNNIRVINIFLFNSKNELLLPKRSANRKIFPNCYDFSCGEHVTLGEEYYDAAIRGLEEELGIKNVKLIELGKLTPKDGANCFMKVYKLVYDFPIVNYDKDGIESLNWFSLEKVKQLLKENKTDFKSDFPIAFEKYFS